MSIKCSLAYYGNRQHICFQYSYERMITIEMKYKEHIKVAFLGGDRRATTAAIKLAEERYDVFSWAIPANDFNGKVVFCEDIGEALKNAEAIVLPLPSSSCTAGHSGLFFHRFVQWSRSILSGPNYN